MEAFLYHITHSLAQLRNGNLAYHLITESITKHCDSRAFTYAASLKIEKSLLVKLTDSATMRALHIIVIDFKEGACLHMGLVGKQNISVCHKRLGFSGSILHKNMTVETSPGGIVDDTLVKFAACTMRFSMLNKNIVIALLLTVHQIKTASLEAATLILHTDDDIVPHMTAAEGDSTHEELCVALHGNFCFSKFPARCCNTLQTVELNMSALSDVQIDQACSRKTHEVVP